MILVGTSGYNYPEWRGSFYPAKLAAKDMLAYYAERFPAVEINATFYRMPVERTLRDWAERTPASFVFTLKAPQRITHQRRLRDVDEPVGTFADVAAVLGPKLGPLFFQLPPSFKKDTARLGDLLALLPRGRRIAFEFRHPTWFSDDVYALLGARDAALCIADTGDGTTPEVATAAWGYLRLRDAAYTDAELARWIETIAAHGWRDAFVYFKHEASGTGPALAQRFVDLLSAGP